MNYASRVKEVERLVRQIEREEDVEAALRAYESAMTHLSACETILADAQGRVSQVGAPDEGATA